VLDAHGLAVAFDSLLQATSEGEVTTEESASVAAILEARRKLLESIELAGRLSVLEKKLTP